MKTKLNLPKKGTKVYTIDDCKIEPYYIVDIKFYRRPESDAFEDLSEDIEVELERYNDGVNSCRTKKRLSHVFTTKKELINNL